MPKVHPNQSNFSQGELSPLISERTDLSVYGAGVATMNNMHPDPRGPALSRVGTKYHTQEVTANPGYKLFTIPGFFSNFVKILLTEDEIFGWDTLYGSNITITNATDVPYSNIQIKDVNMFSFQSASNLITAIFMHQSVIIKNFVIQLSGGSFLYSWADFPMVNAPISWQLNAWPGAGTRYQGRTWLGGTSNDHSRFFATVSGTTGDFTIGTGQPADAIEANINKPGRIIWMDSIKNTLVMGTDSAEYIVQSEGSFLQTSDITINQQSSYGSFGAPAIIGDQILYISTDRRKIRQIGFSFQENSWISSDLTFQSEHLSIPLIKEIVWVQHPNNYLWISLDDGTLVSMSYERDKDIIGWSRHNTDGVVGSIASLFDGQTDVLLLAVTRMLGDNVPLLEVMDKTYQMDSWSETNSGSPLLFADGFDHLEGQTVHVIGDGVLQTSKVVGAKSHSHLNDAAAGRVHLDLLATVVQVGAMFVPELVTLPMDGGGPTGSARNLKKRRNKIVVNVLDSAIPLINGIRQPPRSPSTDMDLGEPVETGDIETVQLGWTRTSTVTIKQDLALPLKIRSIRGEIAENSL